MVSRAPAQGRQILSSNTGSSMWAVVVLGIITAVFAWVWFGGRGERKGSETEHRSLSAETRSEPEQSERKENPVTTQISQEGNADDPESPENTQPVDINEAVHTAGEASHTNFTENESQQELNTVESITGDRKAEGNGQGDNLSENCGNIEEGVTQVHLKPLASQTNMQDESVSEKDVLQDILDTSDIANEVTKAEIHHSAGLSNTTATDEEVNNSIAEVEDLQPSVVTEEKVLHSSEAVSHFIAPHNVLPTSAETAADLLHPVHDDAKLVNGVEERVEKENETVDLQGHFINDNDPSVNGSTSANDYNGHEHNEHDSYEQSDIDFVVEEPSSTLESATSAHVNGPITQANHLSTETCHTDVWIPQKLEDVLLTSEILPAVDKHVDFDAQRTRRVAAVQPISQNVSLGFKVHYITHSNSQAIAVVGDHERLGEWENYVPLNSDKDGYWSHSVTLPADANLEWKFVMVENGKIKRWEECNNRHLRTAHEEIATQQWWGYP